jgi:hypothetical protein
MIPFESRRILSISHQCNFFAHVFTYFTYFLRPVSILCSRDLVFWISYMCIDCIFQGSVLLRLLDRPSLTHLSLFLVKLCPKFNFLFRLALRLFRTEQHSSLSEFRCSILSHSWILQRPAAHSFGFLTKGSGSMSSNNACRYVKRDWVAGTSEFRGRRLSNYLGSIIEILKGVDGVIVNFRVDNNTFQALCNMSPCKLCMLSSS